LQKKEEEKKDEEKLQKKDAGLSSTSSSGISNYVSTINGKGNPLPANANQFFSSKMGYDFSNVKIHTDQTAAESAKDVNAKAYTVGNNVVFNEGQYNTESNEGKKLMAHELAHVVQNFKNTGTEKIQTQRRRRRGPEVRRRTTESLLNDLMAPGSPLWRQLNPSPGSPVNCPATAAAVDEYLSTGHITPAPAGDALSSFSFDTRAMSGRMNSFADVRAALSRPRSFAVVRGTRSAAYLSANPGVTSEHFFTAVNNGGNVILIDAYGSGRIITNVDEFLRQQGFEYFNIFNGNFRVVHHRFDIDAMPGEDEH
jgi:hypothetical protein